MLMLAKFKRVCERECKNGRLCVFPCHETLLCVLFKCKSATTQHDDDSDDDDDDDDDVGEDEDDDDDDNCYKSPLFFFL